MRLVCGVDEAGRGPLAGPVYAAAVILDSGRPIAGIDDSKKLAPARRESLALEIRTHALAWAVASASVEEIDALNILQASLLAMRRAVEKLAVMPHQVLVDGLHCPRVSMPVRAVVRGDASVSSISAASILAKTARDEWMLALHREIRNTVSTATRAIRPGNTSMHCARTASRPCIAAALPRSGSRSARGVTGREKNRVRRQSAVQVPARLLDSRAAARRGIERPGRDSSGPGLPGQRWHPGGGLDQ